MPALSAFLSAISRTCGVFLKNWATRTTARFVTSTFDKISQHCSQLPTRKRALEIKALERSRYIDEQLEQISGERKNTIQVVLLGLQKSGKSTILKQMKINAGRNFRDRELLEYRKSIYKNLVQDAQNLVHKISKCKDKSVPISDEFVNKIISYQINPDPTGILDQGFADSIHWLYNDLIVGAPSNLMKDDGLDDTQERYFLKHAQRIGLPNYMPTIQDILHVQHDAEDLINESITMNHITINIVEFGRLNMQSICKWMHFLEVATSIIFCTSLSDYDQVDEEGNNLLMKSIKLFEGVVTSPWCARATVILFFNKLDIFKKKLPRSRLGDALSDLTGYEGGEDVVEAQSHILQMFEQANQQKLWLFPHFTEDARSERLSASLFGIVATIVLDCNLKDAGLL